METWVVALLISKRQSNIDLFIECPFRKNYLANSLYDSSVTPPKNISNLLGNWLKGIAKNDVKQV
jgi:hypothetical protein